MAQARKERDMIRKTAFIEPMLLFRCDELPNGPEWLQELKFDGCVSDSTGNVIGSGNWAIQ
jgi:hypothetical protein